MSSVGPVEGIAKPLPVVKGAAAEDGEGDLRLGERTISVRLPRLRSAMD